MEREPFGTVYINSKYITGSGTTSSFAISVRGGPLTPIRGRTTKIAVTTAVIPLTYYGVNSTNNVLNMWELQNWPDASTLSVTETPVEGSPMTFSVTFTTVLPANIGLFAGVIASALTAASAASGYGAIYTVVLNADSLNGVLTYEFTNGLTPLTTSSWDLADSTVGPGLGFGMDFSVTLSEGVPLSTLEGSSLIKNFNVTLLSGQYNLTSLQSGLQLQMDARSEAVGFALNYIVSISAENGRITWQISGTPGYSAQLNFDAPTIANPILGLPVAPFTGNSYSTPFTSTIRSYTAPNIINIVGPARDPHPLRQCTV